MHFIQSTHSTTLLNTQYFIRIKIITFVKLYGFDIFNDSNIFPVGYVKTDINGEYIVDVKDLLPAFNNSQYNVKYLLQ